MFLPLKDNLKGSSFPLITAILITVNMLVYYLATSDPVSNYTGAILYGMIPFEVTHAGMQCVPVHSISNMVCGTPNQIHQIYPNLTLPSTMLTFVSSMFLHGGTAHLLGNMLYLFVFGRAVENALGRWSYLMVYFLSGVGAILGQTLWDMSSTVPVIGASGAIAGVMASYLVMFPGARILSLFIVIPCRPRAGWVIGTWIALQIYMAWELAGLGGSGGVAVFEHLAGFGTGAALTYYLIGTERVGAFREMARSISTGVPLPAPRMETVPPAPQQGVANSTAAWPPPAGLQYVAPVPPPVQQYVAPVPPRPQYTPPGPPGPQYAPPAPAPNGLPPG